MSPALQDGLLTTGKPGKSPRFFFLDVTKIMARGGAVMGRPE